MKLGTRLIIFSSVFLVLLPWFAYHFIERIELSIIQGQQEAQSMAALAIATVLNGYTELFDVDEDALYVYPIRQIISIDGYDEDWEQLSERFSYHAADRFTLLLANGALPVNRKYLYAYLRVNDSDVIYRHPAYRRLDTSDHIRLEFLDEDNRHRRFILLTEAQGSVSVYEVNSDWHSWKTGEHVNVVSGIWRETQHGYDLELRLPAVWLEPHRRLAFSVVDVYDENNRSIASIAATNSLQASSSGDGILNPLLFQSAELKDAIKNLDGSDMRICVIDKYRRVRAVLGGQKMPNTLCQSIDRVEDELVNMALRGHAQVSRIDSESDEIIVAAQPVIDNDEIIGVVLVSKDSRQVLSSQRDTLKDVVIATITLFALVLFSLLVFSTWLAFRINRLKSETAAIIDSSGRFMQSIDLADSQHRDEIGDLARSFSSLLDRLNRYTRFLESVPGMLRHEILNPVNTISMTIQKFQSEKENDNDNLCVAEKAISQLQIIVSSLTEAAHIDEALQQDTIETFDIAAMLSEYVSNTQIKHPSARFCYLGVTQGVHISGSDIRIMQLLDKIKDNAIDFSTPGSDIVFQLEKCQDSKLTIHVKNEGQSIPQSRLDVLFQGMLSHRSNTAGEPHLGIGLYVAKRIARYHDGDLLIANRRDKQGVQVSLILPLNE